MPVSAGLTERDHGGSRAPFNYRFHHCPSLIISGTAGPPLNRHAAFRPVHAGSYLANCPAVPLFRRPPTGGVLPGRYGPIPVIRTGALLKTALYDRNGTWLFRYPQLRTNKDCRTSHASGE